MNLSRFLHFRVLVPVFVLPLIVALCCACISGGYEIHSPTVANITINGADLGATVTYDPPSDGGNTHRTGPAGIVYALTSVNNDPKVGGAGVTVVNFPGDEDTTGARVVTVTGLAPGTYSFRGFKGFGGDPDYSEVSTFTTLGPVLASPTSADLTESNATLGGDLTSNGSTITERGVVFAPAAKNENPVLNGPHTTTVPAVGTAEGVFTVAVGGLDPSTAYVFKAYAKGGPVTAYSESATFSTGDSVLGAVGRGITQAIPLPDGKTLVAGSFSSIGGAVRHNIARLLADGTVDPAFTASTGSQISAVFLQADGKILIGGWFGEINGVAVDTGLARLMADGTTDPGFSAETSFGHVYALAVQADGRIVLGGTFLDVNGVTRAWLARLNANGTTDGDFDLGDPFNSPNSPVNSIVIQPDGKILIGGWFSEVHGVTRQSIARLNINGSLDESFVPNVGGDVQSVVLQADGKVLIGGKFTTVGGLSRNGIARLSATGALDTTFDPGTGAFTTSYENVVSIAQQADGKLLVGGQFTKMNGVVRAGVARLHADGSLDESVNPGATFPYAVNGLALREDGRIVIVGGQIGYAEPPPAPRTFLMVTGNAPATRTLSAIGSSAVRWLRGGSAPEVSEVSFELSTNSGATWTPLGVGSRIAGGWEKTGLALPASGLLRARGRTSGGYGNEGSGLAEQIVPFPLPLVTDPAATNLTATGSTLGATVASAGTTITERGVVYSAVADNADPLVGGASVMKVTAAGTTGVFTVPITGLVAGTEYVFKGYATSSAGTGYSSPVFFRAPVLPSVTGRTVTDVGATTATLGGNVTLDGGLPITERGIVYSRTVEDQEPQIGGAGVTKVPAASSGLGVFTIPVQGLLTGTRYSFSAYATTAAGTAYSSTGLFTTLGPPEVGAPTSANLTDTSVTLGGEVTSDGGSPIIERGIAYQQVAGATPERLADKASYTKVAASSAGTGVFTVNVTGLQPGSAYLFAAYAVNAVGTSHTTTQETFTTTGGAPSVEEGASGGSFTESPALESGGLPAGALEDDFTDGVEAGRIVQAIAVQPDGKVIVAGEFNEVGGESRGRIARLNADGSVDPAFLASTDAIVYSLAVDEGGKVLLGGLFGTVNGEASKSIAKLTDTGELEIPTSFSAGSGADNVVYCLAVQPDGKILLGGLFETVRGTARNRIARLNANGSLDETFDPGLGADDAVFSVALQPDGKILLGGAFQNVGGTARSRIARLEADGDLDTTFNPGANDRVTSLAVQPDGRILAGGSFTQIASTPRNRIARLETGGEIDTTFNPGSGANDKVFTMALQTDGKVLIGGLFQTVGVTGRNRIARLHATGAVDTGFDPGDGADDEIDAVALTEDGSILIGGVFRFFDSTARGGLARIANDAATETLTVVDGTALTWQRGGAGPEIPQADFEISTDGGTTWTDLGAGARVAGGWEIAGLDLPVNGLVRSSGRTSGGFLGGSAGVVEESATFNHQGRISSLQSQLTAANANVAKLKKQIKAAKKKKDKAKAKKLTLSLKKVLAQIPKINADLARYP